MGAGFALPGDGPAASEHSHLPLQVWELGELHPNWLRGRTVRATIPRGPSTPWWASAHSHSLVSCELAALAPGRPCEAEPHHQLRPSARRFSAGCLVAVPQLLSAQAGQPRAAYVRRGTPGNNCSVAGKGRPAGAQRTAASVLGIHCSSRWRWPLDEGEARSPRGGAWRLGAFRLPLWSGTWAVTARPVAGPGRWARRPPAIAANATAPAALLRHLDRAALLNRLRPRVGLFHAAASAQGSGDAPKLRISSLKTRPLFG